MTRIASIEVTTATLPLRSATAFSGRTVIARSYCLVRVTGDDGVSGIGFCYAGNVGGGLPAAAVRDLFAPIILGRDAHSTEALWATMYQEGLLHGRTGSVMRALSACDIALWDRNSRAAGLPLWKYLGAYADTMVKAYASGGYYLEGKGPQELADEMRSYVEAGFHAVKMKIGRLSIEADEERLAAARDAVGPHVEIMLDCNNGFADLTVALRSMKRWEKYDPYWIEEPFGPDDIESHARLAERTPVLVATGEIEAGRWRHHELLSKKAAVILQTDAAVCGGVSEYRRIAATAARITMSANSTSSVTSGRSSRTVRRKSTPARQRSIVNGIVATERMSICWPSRASSSRVAAKSGCVAASVTSTGRSDSSAVTISG